jgi:hypothetical protein
LDEVVSVVLIDLLKSKKEKFFLKRFDYFQIYTNGCFVGVIEVFPFVVLTGGGGVAIVGFVCDIDR